MPAWPACEEPLSTIQKHLPCRGVGFLGHHLGDEIAERGDTGDRAAATHHGGVVDVECGQVGQGAAWGVLELDPSSPFWGGRQVAMAAAQRLKLGLLIGADDVLVGTQPSAFPGPL
jgi:hypothetical protein